MHGHEVHEVFFFYMGSVAIFGSKYALSKRRQIFKNEEGKE